MKCRYCNAPTHAQRLCDDCKRLLDDYRYEPKHFTVLHYVTKANAEYKLLHMPNPPYNMMFRHNDCRWPSSLSYVSCGECGVKTVLGTASVRKHIIICKECKEKD